MASLGGFNAGDQDTSQRSTLPLGIYRLEFEASDVVPTKAGNGQILKATINVIEPESHKGRKMFWQENIANSNAVAEKIGKDNLAKVIRAMGDVRADPEDTEELHFHPFVAKVGLDKAQEGYEAKNKIVAYYYPDEATDEKPLPTPGLLAEPPAGKAPVAANQNRQPAANSNDSRSTGNGGSAVTKKGANPWTKGK